MGEEITLTVEVLGGVAPYQAEINGQILQWTEAGKQSVAFLPEAYGDIAIVITATDAQGETATVEAVLPVSSGVAESRGAWEKSIGSFTPSGDWARDLLAVAKTQLGYAENETNFVIDEAGEKHAYTRYGDWAGSPYAEWNASFVAFCLEYAQIDRNDFPRAKSAASWKSALDDLYENASGEYAPQPGDLIFIHADPENPGSNGGAPTRVGIVSGVSASAIHAIEGDSDGQVRTQDYDRQDPAIVGYANLALAEQRAGGVAEEPEAYEALAGGYRFTVRLEDPTALPEGATMRVETLTAEEALETARTGLEATGETGSVVDAASFRFVFADENGEPLQPQTKLHVTFERVD